MKLNYDPVSYVLQEGNSYHIALMHRALGRKEEKTFEQAMADLRELQNQDGGWPWRWEKDKPSGIQSSSRTLGLFLKIGENKSSELSKKCVDFLLKKQNKNGGWAENKELKDVIPNEWGWISTKYSNTGITGGVIQTLVAAGWGDDSRVRKALEFLRKTQNREGGWEAYIGRDYPYGTDLGCMADIVRAFLKTGEPKDSLVFQRVKEALSKRKEEWKEPVCNPCDTLFLLDFGLDHPQFQEALSLLIKAQREDGGWNWFGDLPSNPGQTAYWITQLVKFKIEI